MTSTHLATSMSASESSTNAPMLGGTRLVIAGATGDPGSRRHPRLPAVTEWIAPMILVLAVGRIFLAITDLSQGSIGTGPYIDRP
jgi:hypothetical protein